MHIDREDNLKLRRTLQAMTEETDGARHPELLRKLSLEYPNTVTFLESPYPLHRYTCFVHAFGFTEEREYVSIAERGFNYVYASPEFAHWLIDQRLISEITEADLLPKDLAFYFSTDSRIRHAAVFVGSDRFQSKWGLGYLFEHALFEVPDTYGESVRFYKHLPYPHGIKHFIAFAQYKGMNVTIRPNLAE